MSPRTRTTAIFAGPFRIAGFEEVLPAGEYALETELLDPAVWIDPGAWAASVLVHLHPRASHPGLCRILSVPLAELDAALAKDKLTGQALSQVIFDDLLADPMIRLVMQADGVSGAEICSLYGERPERGPRRYGANGHADTRGGGAPATPGCRTKGE